MKFLSLFFSLAWFFSLHGQTVLQSLEGCYEKICPATEKNEEVFAWFSEIPLPFFNSVMHISSKNVAIKIDELIAKAPEKKLISFWVHPENQVEDLKQTLKEKGFSLAATCPLMFWNVRPVKERNFSILSFEVNPSAFDRLTTKMFHLNKKEHQKYFDLIENLDAERYLIYSEDQVPIGTGLLIVNGNVGGVFNVGILPKYQKKGFGKAMMHHLMRRAHERGLEKLVLLSSFDAEDFYEHLGFETVFDVDIYIQ